MGKNMPTTVQVRDCRCGPEWMDLECMVKIGPSDFLAAELCPAGLEGRGGIEEDF